MHDLVLLPPAPKLAAFAAAGLAVNLTPGADMTFAVSGARADRHGRRGSGDQS